MAEGFEEKVAYFQAITGLDDPDLCTEILGAHNWDLEQAISSFTSPPPAASGGGAASTSVPPPNAVIQPPGPPGIAWRLITLPFYVASGGVGLVVGSVKLGAWVAGTVLSKSLSLLGLAGPQGGEGSDRLVSLSASAAEALQFVNEFTRDFGSSGPRFVSEGFMDALQRSQREYKLLFVYLHSPDHPDVPIFCEGCLCAAPVAAFINENFVSWGGSIRRTEGFKMSNSLNASRFPFCAVVMGSTNQRIVLLQQASMRHDLSRPGSEVGFYVGGIINKQIKHELNTQKVEGLKSPEEMLTILQRVIEECAPTLVAARMEAEERLTNQRLREEQDAAYRAALEADQARERQRMEEQERKEREEAEAERKRKEEEEERERKEREAVEREAALARRRQEKAVSLGAEPDKGPDVTQVLIRFPTGERKERRFHSTATISALYDYVDSLDCLKAEKYSLVSNFPRVIYGMEKHSLTLKEAGLHPHAGLFVEVE